MSNDHNILNKTRNAAKWSTITELATKFVTPITQMFLARLLAPEAFGIIATISMIISFTDMFTDAGFQKYIIQREFKNRDELYKSLNVAFWTNLFVSVVLWLLIIILRKHIATLVGNPGLGNVIAIACIQLPLTSFSSLQVSLFRRDFNFQFLFYARMIVALIPIFTTIPLALMGMGFWSLIIGSISSIFVNAVILTIKSSWKPNLYFDFAILKEMFSFSMWLLLESFVVWLTAWVDAFIIGSSLNSYYLGLYKNSLNMVNSILAIVSSAIMPVLFTTLSRIQKDIIVFENTFLNVQKILAYILFPIGAGIFLYSDIATSILLGEKWAEASKIIGIWALIKSIRIVMISINSEVYRAKGLPKLSLFLQSIDLVILIPACVISVKYGFWNLVYTRALLMLDLIIPTLIVMQKHIHINAKKVIKNISKPVLSTTIMGITSLILKLLSNSVMWSIISMVICAVIYVISIYYYDKGSYRAIMSIIIRKR